MKRLFRLIPLFAVPLALAAPVVSACGADAGTTMHCAMPEMQSMEMHGCHDASVTSNECCESRSAPESIAALSDKNATAFLALETGKRHEVVPPPATRPALALLADGGCLYGLGRYKLFSSFLL